MSTLKQVYPYAEQIFCLIVCFTARLTSLIFQQKRNGFKVELKNTMTFTIPLIMTKFGNRSLPKVITVSIIKNGT